ncbi:hypothetical protein D3Z50_22575 [Clostridiaceae bacterium]|nr:hypothetical protein [Clostridiaceae bacterium]
MINRDSRGHSYFIVRGEILGFMKDEQLRKHLPRMFSLIKNESWGLEDDQIPSYGSQYNNQGKVVRGPAPLSLALAHADIDDGKVVFVPWVETDFRTGENPWWA